MEVLKSKALDNVMHREYYGLLVWNDLQADRPIDHFNSEWLKNNRGVEEDYLISVLDRVDKELSKEHASLLALVLVDFDFVYAAYYLGGYFDGFREFYKAFKYYQMCIKDERYSVKIKERFNELDTYFNITGNIDEIRYISKERIKDFLKHLKSIDKLEDSVNDIYINYCKENSDMDSVFSNIYCYEDLFEYLINRYDLRFSKILANYVCYGEIDKFPFKEELSSHFIRWAKGVRHLCFRNYIIVLNSVKFFKYFKYDVESKNDEKLLLKEVKDFIIYNGYSSINSIQRMFNIDCNKALEIMEKLVDEGFLYKVNKSYKYLKR